MAKMSMMNSWYLRAFNKQDNAEAVETLESYTVNASDFIEATPARPEATVAKSASAIFPCSMVSPWLRDKPNSIEHTVHCR